MGQFGDFLFFLYILNNLIICNIVFMILKYIFSGDLIKRNQAPLYFLKLYMALEGRLTDCVNSF